MSCLPKLRARLAPQWMPLRSHCLCLQESQSLLEVALLALRLRLRRHHRLIRRHRMRLEVTVDIMVLELLRMRTS